MPDFTIAMQGKPTVELMDPMRIAAQGNAMAMQRMQMQGAMREQQRNAMLDQLYSQSLGPDGGIDTAKLTQGLAGAGLGGEIPGVLESQYKMDASRTDSAKKNFEFGLAINAEVRNSLETAQSPEDVLASARQLAAQYPMVRENLKKTLLSMPSDPAQFAAWKAGQMRLNLEAKDRMEQHFITQDLGGSVRTLQASKYGAGPATVLPGSEAQKTISPKERYELSNPALKPVTVEGLGVVGYNPRTNTYTPAGAGSATTSAGGIPSANLTVDTLRPLFVAQESGGNYKAVSPKGALGAYQVMPETGVVLARKMGKTWQPELMVADTPEGRAYQDAIGGAAIQEAINAGAGDPAEVFAYYHAGPDKAKRGPITAGYVGDMQRRMGAAPAANAGAQPGQTTMQAAQAPGRAAVNRITGDMVDWYTQLDQLKGIPNNERETSDNLSSSLAASGVGQWVGRAVGSKEQTLRDQIKAGRRMLLQKIKTASGMSAQEMNSNVELQGLLEAASDPSQSYQAAIAILGQIEREYGSPTAPGVVKAQGSAKKPAGKTVVRTGQMNGRRVVQYSDGTTAYAD